MKYLKGNMYTALEKERDACNAACSSHAIFLKSLEDLKDLFYRNLYSNRLVEYKIKIFLSVDKKPERDLTDISIVFEYTSPHIVIIGNTFV